MPLHPINIQRALDRIIRTPHIIPQRPNIKPRLIPRLIPPGPLIAPVSKGAVRRDQLITQHPPVVARPVDVVDAHAARGFVEDDAYAAVVPVAFGEAFGVHVGAVGGVVVVGGGFGVADGSGGVDIGGGADNGGGAVGDCAGSGSVEGFAGDWDGGGGENRDGGGGGYSCGFEEFHFRGGGGGWWGLSGFSC